MVVFRVTLEVRRAWTPFACRHADMEEAVRPRTPALAPVDGSARIARFLFARRPVATAEIAPRQGHAHVLQSGPGEGVPWQQQRWKGWRKGMTVACPSAKWSASMKAGAWRQGLAPVHPSGVATTVLCLCVHR